MVENLKFKSHPDPATYRAMENPKIILFYFQVKSWLQNVNWYYRENPDRDVVKNYR